MLTEAPETPTSEAAKPVEPVKPGETPPEPGKPPEPPVVEFKPVTLAELKLPEGITLAPEASEQFNALALEAKLSGETAQKFLDQHVAVVKAVSDHAVKEVTQAFIDQGNAWAKATREDKEIGGQNLAEVQRTVAKAFDLYGDPDVKKALNETGAGNHPAITRTLYRMAKALTEGGPARQGQPASPAPSAAKTFYPNMQE